MAKRKQFEESKFDNIDRLIDNTFSRLKDVIDANTVIGSSIKLTDKMFIIPISKVSVGLITGGGEFPNKNEVSANACSTTGFSITPMGFVTINENLIDYITAGVVDNGPNRMLDTLVNIFDKMMVNKEKIDED